MPMPKLARPYRAALSTVLPIPLALALALALTLLLSRELTAQTASTCWLRGATPEQAAQRPSPHASTSVAFGGGTLQVCYGAPSARGRTIVGGLNPHGEPWRMGANEATTLHVPSMVMAGGVHLEPGVYSIFGIPTAGAWTVVFNRQSERWGIPIDDAVRQHDVGRLTVTPEPLSEPVETLRYRFEPRGDAVDLVMEFERNRIRIPIDRMLE
jgi:hypothetical protein